MVSAGPITPTIGGKVIHHPGVMLHSAGAGKRFRGRLNSSSKTKLIQTRQSFFSSDNSKWTKISWRHWLSKHGTCWQLNLFTPYLGSANGKLLLSGQKAQGWKVFFHIISCCYQHYGIWELPWIISSGCHKNKDVLLLSSSQLTGLSHSQTTFAPLFPIADFVVGLSYQPLSTLGVWSLFLNYFQRNRNYQSSRIWGEKVRPWLPLFRLTELHIS